MSVLGECAGVELCRRAPPASDGPDRLTRAIDDLGIDTIVFAPVLTPGKQAVPDLRHAEALFRCFANAGIRRLILLASAAAWECSHHNPGLISESRPLRAANANQIAAAWIQLEGLARACLAGSSAELTILRPAPMPVRGGGDFFSSLFSGRIGVTFTGYDPSIQILSLEDLGRSVRCAIESDFSKGSVFNVAPDSVIPLRRALSLAGVRRIPAPHGVQRLARAALAPAGLAHPIDQVDYIRYSFTVSNKKIKRGLGFVPARSSAEALLEFKPERGKSPQARKIATTAYDDFGMDKGFIAACGRRLFNFLERYYWRIEVDGLGNVPRLGRGVLAGVHRGFMPWDGVMALHLMARRIQRYPRFLVHPGLVKFPFLFNFFQRLGGVHACRQNADYLLERGEMVGIFPEGVNGAFSLYRDAYRLGKFGRDEFVKTAVRNRAPIVPFVTVGSAEVFPILKKIEWKWWKRRMEWPCFPITPTFPLLPLPLPSKWHTQFLPAIHVEERYAPEAARDAAIVRAISREVREQLQEAMNAMLARRRSIFHGSIFEPGSG